MKLIKNLNSQCCVVGNSSLQEYHVVSSCKILQTFRGVVIFLSKFPGSFLKILCLKLRRNTLHAFGSFLRVGHDSALIVTASLGVCTEHTGIVDLSCCVLNIFHVQLYDKFHLEIFGSPEMFIFKSLPAIRSIFFTIFF